MRSGWVVAVVLMGACSLPPTMHVPPPSASASRHWLVATGLPRSTMEVAVLDARGRTLGGWRSERLEHGSVHDTGGRSWFRRPGPHRLIVTATVEGEDTVRVEIPVHLRGDERLVWVELGGYRQHWVRVRLLVPASDATLRSLPASEALRPYSLEITNHGDARIHGIGNPSGWFQALWVRMDGDTLAAVPTPWLYCGTGMMPVPHVSPGGRAPAGDSPWAIGNGLLELVMPNHAFVPFVRTGRPTESASGVQGGVEWEVVRLRAAEVSLPAAMTTRGG